jgi:SAM-dependent methyltransferase
MWLRRLRKYFWAHWTDVWPEVVAQVETMPTLHLGSGFAPIAGATTVDLNPAARPHVIWDLNKRPWPFADNSFEIVVALNIVEHLDDFLSVMGEIHRVARPGAMVNILVPHFSSGAAFVDPTHKQHLSARSCDYFIEGSSIEKDYGYYVPYRYELVRCFVELAPAYRYLPGAAWLARHHTALWEDYLCYVLRGAGIFWQLKVVK